MDSLTVSLADRSYPIHIGRGVISRSDLLLPHLTSPKAVIVTNTTVAPLYADAVSALLRDAGVESSSNHSISLAPVFVYEFAGESVKPYVEAGIGVAAFENTEVEGNGLGSSFQFEDRIGAGLRFAGGHEVGVRAIHYSNAGIKKPNDGVESYALHYRMAF